MNIERLDEMVKVRADFQGGVITPLRLKRKNNEIRVRKINGRWIDREGTYPRYCFSITTSDGTDMQLTLRTQDMIWQIDTVSI